MTNPTSVQSSPRHDGSHVVLSVLLWISVLATFVTALGTGWFQVYFQLFGEVADRADYTAAVGIYALGAGLLALAPMVAALFRLGIWCSLTSLAGSLVLVALAVDAHRHAAAMAAGSLSSASWREALPLFAAFPWVWSLPALLLGAVLTRVSSLPWDSRSTSAT
jgi:hypothetical protein